MLGAGARRHLVTLSTPSTPQPDGDGGYTATPEALVPETMYAAIEPLSARDLMRRDSERVMAGTTLSVATHLVTLPYHAQVTTQTLITYNSRIFRVTGVVNPEERNRETICTCVELVQ